VFNKYLRLGGIDAGAQNMFSGGLDKDLIEQSTAEGIREFTATDYIHSAHTCKFYSVNDIDNWLVDFEGVAKGFL
jgi:hypothetical protein